MAELSNASNGAGTATPSMFSYNHLKDSLKKYGRTGIAVYLGISFCVTTGFYVAIERHFDVKSFLGIQDKSDREPTFIEKVVTGKGSSLALAILCSKAFVPIKLPVAVAVTPYVHRTIQNMWKGSVSKAI